MVPAFRPAGETASMLRRLFPMKPSSAVTCGLENQQNINQSGSLPTSGNDAVDACMINCVEVEKKAPPECFNECIGGNTTTGKCGDGVCDAFETTNVGICPLDCENIT